LWQKVNSHNPKFRVVVVLKQPERVLANQEMPQSEIRVVAVEENDNNAFWQNLISRTRRGRFLLQPRHDVR
jgi:hypothetical protein